MRKKASISRAVREALTVRPCVVEALKMNIVNYSALARFLIDDVEKRVGTKVNLASVKMAIVRLARYEAAQKESLEKSLIQVIGASSLTFVDDIVVMTLWEKGAYKMMSKLFEKAEKARFFQITQGVGHMTFIADNNVYEELRQEIPSNFIEAVIENQTAIVMTSPREILETPGVVSYVTSMLSSKGINITQFISCHTDSIFVVNKQDAIQVYMILNELIEKFRRIMREQG